MINIIVVLMMTMILRRRRRLFSLNVIFMKVPVFPFSKVYR